MSEIAQIYETGKGAKVDFALARHWYERALAAGDAWSAQRLGLMDDRGAGGPTDPAAACSPGTPRRTNADCARRPIFWAVATNSVTGVAKDPARALALYRQSAEAGYDAAQFTIGIEYLLGSQLENDPAQAAEWIRKSAEQGFALAQYHLASLYQAGTLGEPDPAQAIEWYRKAAAQDNLAAQLNLGALLCDREKPDSPECAESLTWLRKAAGQNQPAAQHDLGIYFHNGIGTKRDDAQALAWLSKAAAQSFAPSQYQLGTMYRAGEGVPKNLPLALRWMRKAADTGLPDAECDVGGAYATGTVVGRDMVRAYAWMSLGAVADEECKQLAENVRASLSPAQIKKAEALAKTLAPGVSTSKKAGYAEKK